MIDGTAALDALPVAVYTTDAEGRITFFNDAAAELWGRRPELTTSFWCGAAKLFWPDGREMALEECPMAVSLRDGVAVRGVEAILERPDGSRVPFMPFPTPLRDGEGRITGGINLLLDITDRGEREIEAARLASIVSSSDDVIISKTLDGIVTSWNAGAERIKGYRAEEIVGHHFSRFYPEDAVRSGWPGTELKIAAERGRFEEEGWRMRKDGSRFWASVVITALYYADGGLRGFAKITRDLTDRRRAERLEADAEQISQFIAMLAHELRNPLAPIRNAATLAQREQNSSLTQWALEVIDRQSAQVVRLVDDLLDMSRVTRGQIRIENRRLNLRQLLDDAVEAVRPSIDQRNHQLTVQGGNGAMVRGDRVRLVQVFTNLLGNACKYTLPGGRIEVAVTTDEESVVVSVRDSGVGIAPDLLPRLFDIFTQGDRALDRAEGGLGLGLAISSRLVQLHGGTLTAESAGPGCGSTFVVRLPLLSDGTVDVGEEGYRTVLVIDDNVDAAQTMKALLEAHGHKALIAFDGESGLQLANQHTPDVVLLDIGLPGMDGYEVARAIRGSSSLRGVVLAAVTGYGSDDDRRRASEAGFDLHMSKPVEYETIKRKIQLLDI